MRARDETAKAAREREITQDQISCNLVAEVERVNERILGEWTSLFICFNYGLFFLTLPA